MRRIIIAVAGLALASAASHDSAAATPKCRKGTVTVAGFFPNSCRPGREDHQVLYSGVQIV